VRRVVAPLLSLIVVVAAAIALLTYLTEERYDTHLVVQEVGGTADVESPEATAKQIHRGRKIRARDTVRTGTDGHAVLSFGDDTEIRLGTMSTIAVQKIDQEGVTLELEDGALEATVRKGTGALRVGAGDREILTLDADFRMGRRGDNLTVDVQRGDLQVTGMPGVDRLAQGSRARVSGTGGGSVASIPEDLLLTVQWPERRTRADTVALTGMTEPGATVRVDGGSQIVEVTANADGGYSALVPLQEGTSTLLVESTDVFGIQTHQEGTVERDTRGPTFQAGVEYNP